MKKIYTLVLVLGMSSSALNAQLFVPDSAFEGYLTSIGFGWGTPNDNLVAASVAAIQNLDISNLGISDLTGLTNFVSLVSLNVSGNPVTSIDLSNCSNLMSLNCNNNNLTSLDVSNNNSLIQLRCNNNAISVLNVTSNPQLQILECASNNMSSLNINGISDLRQLRFPGNNINIIDVSLNNNLFLLDCSNNELTGLNLFNNTNLQSVNCSNNSITGFLIVNQHSSLTTLNATNNALTCIQVGNVDAANSGGGQYINWNKDASTSYANNCAISFPYTNIPDTSFEQRLINLGIDSEGVLNGRVLNADIEGLISLHVGFGNIQSLAGIEGFTALQTLIVTSNNITSLDLSQNENLRSLQCGLNDIEELDLSQNTDLNLLYCNNNLLTSLILPDTGHLISLRVQSNPTLTSITGLESHDGLVEFRLNSTGLSPVIDVSEMDGLVTFIASTTPNLLCIQVADAEEANNGNGIYSSWSVDAVSTFSETFCDDILTYVPDDNFEGRLVELGYDNAIDDYVITANIENIVSLDASNRDIEDITGIEDFIALEVLNVSNNQEISDMSGMQTLTNLIELRCQGNDIFNLDLSQNVNLVYLLCANNILTSIDLTANTLLDFLHIGNNDLPDLDLSQNINLRTLYCYDNSGLISLDLTNNPLLELVNCQSNDILQAVNASANPNLIDFNSYSCEQLLCVQVAEADLDAANNGTGQYVDWDTDSWTNYSDETCPLLSSDKFEAVENAIRVYPNPARAHIYISSPNTLTIENVTLYDIEGRRVLQTETFKEGIEISRLNNGIYFLSIKAEGYTISKKVIVSK